MSYELSPQAKSEQQHRIANHDAEQEKQARYQQMRDQRNAETRKQYLGGLEARKVEEAKLRNLEIDAELQPRKQFLQREWLANQPGKTSIDFEKAAWPHLRENLIVERDELARQATIAEGRASGLYSL